MYSYRTSLTITDHEGRTIECHALKSEDREKFFMNWERVQTLLMENTICRAALRVSTLRAMQFMADSKLPDMVEAQSRVRFMLGYYGIRYNKLDIKQIHDLFFEHEGKDGKLFELEFVPTAPGANTFSSDLSPRAIAIASIAIINGDYYGAKQVVDSMTAAEISEVIAAINEVSDHAKKRTGKKSALTANTANAGDQERMILDPSHPDFQAQCEEFAKIASGGSEVEQRIARANAIRAARKRAKASPPAS